MCPWVFDTIILYYVRHSCPNLMRYDLIAFFCLNSHFYLIWRGLLHFNAISHAIFCSTCLCLTAFRIKCFSAMGPVSPPSQRLPGNFPWGSLRGLELSWGPPFLGFLRRLFWPSHVITYGSRFWKGLLPSAPFCRVKTRSSPLLPFLAWLRSGAGSI